MKIFNYVILIMTLFVHLSCGHEDETPCEFTEVNTTLTIKNYVGGIPPTASVIYDIIISDNVSDCDQKITYDDVGVLLYETQKDIRVFESESYTITIEGWYLQNGYSYRFSHKDTYSAGTLNPEINLFGSFSKIIPNTGGSGVGVQKCTICATTSSDHFCNN